MNKELVDVLSNTTDIHDDKGEMVYPSNPFSVENTQVYENQLP